jgi:hypothetical protein
MMDEIYRLTCLKVSLIMAVPRRFPQALKPLIQIEDQG